MVLIVFVQILIRDNTNWFPYFGYLKFYSQLFYENNISQNPIITDTLTVFSYLSDYESPVLNGNIYTFKIDPSKSLFLSQFGLDINNLSDIYLAGEFNEFLQPDGGNLILDPEYKLELIGNFYEISLSNVISGQAYKFVPIKADGTPYGGWVTDVVNYRISDDGYGGYNSVIP